MQRSTCLAILLTCVSINEPLLAQSPTRVDAFGDPLPKGAITRLGTLRYSLGSEYGRHSNWGNLTPDGQTLALRGNDHVALWEVKTGKEIRRFPFPPECRPRYQLSPDGKVLGMVLGTSNHEQNLVLRNVETGKRVPCSLPAAAVSGLSLSDNLVAVEPEYGDGVIAVWDFRKNKEVRRLPGIHKCGVGCLISRQEDILVSYYGNNGYHPNKRAEELMFTVQVWDLATGKEQSRYMGERWDYVHAHLLSPDGRTLVLDGRNSFKSEIRFIDTKTGRLKQSLRLEYPHGADLVTFSPNSQRLITCSRQRQITEWDVRTGKEIKQYDVPKEFYCAGIRFVKLGLYCWGSSGYNVMVWDSSTGRKWGKTGKPTVHRSWIDCIFVSGEKIIAVDVEQLACQWQISNGQLLHAQNLRTQEPSKLSIFIDRPQLLSPGGQRYLHKSDSGVAYVKDVTTGKVIHEFGKPENLMPSVARMSPDGRFVVTAEKRDQLKFIEIKTGRILHRLTLQRRWNNDKAKQLGQGATPEVWEIRFLPDGKTILVVSGTRTFSGVAHSQGSTVWVQFFNVDTGKLLWGLYRDYLHDDHDVCYLSPLGDRFVCCWRDRITIRDWPGGTIRHKIDEGGSTCAFSPNGRLLAVARESLITLYEVETGQVRQELRGQRDGHVTTLGFSPNGKYLVSGSKSGTLLLWDVTGSLTFKPSGRLTPPQLAQSWAILREDAGKAQSEIARMIASPEESIPWLRSRLRPDQGHDPEMVRGWIAKLDAKRYQQREEAMQWLLKVGRPVEQTLQEALQKESSLEARQRIRQLLEQIKQQKLAPEMIRQIRAIEILEHVGNREALVVLRRLARGDDGSLQSRAAREALGRTTTEYTEHTERKQDGKE